MDSQSSFQVSSWQETANAQDDNGWAHVPTPFYVPAPSRDRLFQLNAPIPNGPSVLEFGILQQDIQMQDAGPVHVPSLFVTPALSQSYDLQPNASTPVQPCVPGLSTWPPVWFNRIEAPITTTCANIDFLVPVSLRDQVCQLDVPMHLQPPLQELSIGKRTSQVQDPGPAHVPHFTMPLFQDRVPQFDALTFHQPLAWDFNIGQQTVQVQDSSDVHFPFQSVMPASPQNQARQPNAPMSPLLLVCPKSNCRVQFHRRQERDRHIRSHFAHSLFCPFPRCAWRGSRQDVFKVHWKRNHQKHGQAPVRRQNVIYNPDPLVKLVHWNALMVESASEISLSIVRIRAEKLNKLGVWEGGWGRRAKFSQ